MYNKNELNLCILVPVNMLKRDYSNNIHFIFLFLLGCRLVFIFSNTSTPQSAMPKVIETAQEETTMTGEVPTISDVTTQEPPEQIL